MLRRTTIRTRVLVGLALPALALVGFVASDLGRGIVGFLLAAAVVTIGVGIALAIARSISRPLTVLAEQVADVNHLQRLDGTVAVDELLAPRLVEHGYGGEIGQLASAIATGRRRALQTVAQEHDKHASLKEMAATSAQRTTGVLRTALEQIDDLARRDHDPSTATSLASVQRMVARADRHTVGVLTLLGQDTPARDRDTAVAEVLWGACLAVDAADRIDLVSMADGWVAARAVNDLAHLLAELLENAAYATGESSRVTVLGEATDVGYLVTVVDHGGGMDGIELAEANRRVARAVAGEPMPTRALGLDVVGRLARRQGILVRLGESADGGIVVRVEIPAVLLAEGPEPEAFVTADDTLIEPGAAPTLAVTSEPAIVDEPSTIEPAPELEPVAEAEPEVEVAPAAAELDLVAAHAADDAELEEPDIEPAIEITAPPLVTPRRGWSSSPSIVIDPLPYVVRVNRPPDELLPSAQRKKRWAASLAKVGQ